MDFLDIFSEVELAKEKRQQPTSKKSKKNSFLGSDDDYDSAFDNVQSGVENLAYNQSAIYQSINNTVKENQGVFIKIREDINSKNKNMLSYKVNFFSQYKYDKKNKDILGDFKKCLDEDPKAKCNSEVNIFSLLADQYKNMLSILDEQKQSIEYSYLERKHYLLAKAKSNKDRSRINKMFINSKKALEHTLESKKKFLYNELLYTLNKFISNVRSTARRNKLNENADEKTIADVFKRDSYVDTDITQADFNESSFNVEINHIQRMFSRGISNLLAIDSKGKVNYNGLKTVLITIKNLKCSVINNNSDDYCFTIDDDNDDKIANLNAIFSSLIGVSYTDLVKSLNQKKLALEQIIEARSKVAKKHSSAGYESVIEEEKNAKISQLESTYVNVISNINEKVNNLIQSIVKVVGQFTDNTGKLTKNVDSIISELSKQNKLHSLTMTVEAIDKQFQQGMVKFINADESAISTFQGVDFNDVSKVFTKNELKNIIYDEKLGIKSYKSLIKAIENQLILKYDINTYGLNSKLKLIKSRLKAQLENDYQLAINSSDSTLYSSLLTTQKNNLEDYIDQYTVSLKSGTILKSIATNLASQIIQIKNEINEDYDKVTSDRLLQRIQMKGKNDVEVSEQFSSLLTDQKNLPIISSILSEALSLDTNKDKIAVLMDLFKNPNSELVKSLWETLLKKNFFETKGAKLSGISFKEFKAFIQNDLADFVGVDTEDFLAKLSVITKNNIGVVEIEDFLNQMFLTHEARTSSFSPKLEKKMEKIAKLSVLEYENLKTSIQLDEQSSKIDSNEIKTISVSDVDNLKLKIESGAVSSFYLNKVMGSDVFLDKIDDVSGYANNDTTVLAYSTAIILSDPALQSQINNLNANNKKLSFSIDKNGCIVTNQKNTKCSFTKIENFTEYIKQILKASSNKLNFSNYQAYYLFSLMLKGNALDSTTIDVKEKLKREQSTTLNDIFGNNKIYINLVEKQDNDEAFKTYFDEHKPNILKFLKTVEKEAPLLFKNFAISFIKGHKSVHWLDINDTPDDNFSLSQLQNNDIVAVLESIDIDHQIEFLQKNIVPFLQAIMFVNTSHVTTKKQRLTDKQEDLRLLAIQSVISKFPALASYANDVDFLYHIEETMQSIDSNSINETVESLEASLKDPAGLKDLAVFYKQRSADLSICLKLKGIASFKSCRDEVRISSFLFKSLKDQKYIVKQILKDKYGENFTISENDLARYVNYYKGLYKTKLLSVRKNLAQSFMGAIKQLKSTLVQLKEQNKENLGIVDKINAKIETLENRLAKIEKGTDEDTNDQLAQQVYTDIVNIKEQIIKLDNTKAKILNSKIIYQDKDGQIDNERYKRNGFYSFKLMKVRVENSFDKIRNDYSNNPIIQNFIDDYENYLESIDTSINNDMDHIIPKSFFKTYTPNNELDSKVRDIMLYSSYNLMPLRASKNQLKGTTLLIDLGDKSIEALSKFDVYDLYNRYVRLKKLKLQLSILKSKYPKKAGGLYLKATLFVNQALDQYKKDNTLDLSKLKARMFFDNPKNINYIKNKYKTSINLLTKVKSIRGAISIVNKTNKINNSINNKTAFLNELVLLYRKYFRNPKERIKQNLSLISKEAKPMFEQDVIRLIYKYSKLPSFFNIIEQSTIQYTGE